MLSKIISMVMIAMLFLPCNLFAATQTKDASGYLDYKEPIVNQTSSASSTFLYILSIIFAFCVVLFLAYFVSRLLGSKLGTFASMKAGNKIVGVLPLDQNKRIIFLEMAGSILVLGVTEQNISLLKEVSSLEEANKIKSEFSVDSDTGLFGQQSKSLDSLQQKIKPLLRNFSSGKNGDSKK